MCRAKAIFFADDSLAVNELVSLISLSSETKSSANSQQPNSVAASALSAHLESTQSSSLFFALHVTDKMEQIHVSPQNSPQNVTFLQSAKSQLDDFQIKVQTCSVGKVTRNDFCCDLVLYRNLSFGSQYNFLAKKMHRIYSGLRL